MNGASATQLRPLVGDLRQVAGVRRIVLDDGPERGVRALVFSTGGGLDFWVTVDRSLDIGLLFWQGVQLGWQSPAGLPSPGLSHPDGDDGFGFSRGFGGFLVTCGLDHIRQPREGKPLHGRLPHTPARLNSYGEDWNPREPFLYCEGEIVQWRHGAETFRLTRRLEAPIGGQTLRISDIVENIGPEPCPLFLLYHFNLGHPAVKSGTTVELNGKALLGPLEMPQDGQPPLAELFSLPAGARADCRVHAPGGPQVRFSWRAETLPYLQLWRDLRSRCGVLSIEPCNVGRNGDGSNADAPILPPGASARFEMDIDIGDAAGTAAQSGN
jgi:hypothetical protein